MASSDDEPQERTLITQERGLNYKCPEDFVPFSYDPSTSALLDSDENELWLIKAPAHFDAKCFANLKVPLSGLEMVRSKGKAPHTYSVRSSRKAPSDLHLLIADGTNKTPSLGASGFSGVLNISESYSICSENQTLIPIPTAPAPCIPPGLKQRFQPFGSSAPHVEGQGSNTSPKRTRMDPDLSEERRKKKKKKKDKHDGEKTSQDVFIKQEEMQIECHQTQLPDHVEQESKEERRKKKKMKKEKERSEETIDSSLLLKTEPLHPYCVDIDTPGKTKKKKKSRNE
ncbi:DNA-directed RNA polymerase I subunit RPA34 [Paramisgurnus dabryanus]|uniref:DNA-directed RNA polymerase I subunit RPA34 n=1 Tax=Paramisgurnus dabryanus TaxID=90735 RepID=UPI0031F36531